MSYTIIPLHPAQQEVYVDQLINPESSHYNLCGYFRITGTLNKETLNQAIRSLPEIFDVFKMRFSSGNTSPGGYIDETYHHFELTDLPPDFYESAQLTRTEKTRHAEKWIKGNNEVPFKMTIDSVLAELYLIDIASDEHWLYYKYHHLVTDGVGLSIINQYIAKKYKSLTANDGAVFNSVSYQNEIFKAAAYCQSEAYAKEGDYWKQKIGAGPEKLLERKYQRKNISRNKGGSFLLELKPEEEAELNALMTATNSTLQQLTIAALLIYYGQTKQKHDFTFGIPLHKRKTRQMRSIAGMFSGIIPYKGTYVPEMKLMDMISSIAFTQRSDYRYQNYLIGDLSRHFNANSQNVSLLDVIVNNAYVDMALDFGEGIRSYYHFLSPENVTFPLEFCWINFGEGIPLQLRVYYQLQYFDEIEIQLLTTRLLFILNQFKTNPNQELRNINILPEAEQNLLKQFNPQIKDRPRITINDCFEVQAKHSPDSIALIYQETTVTYQELDRSASQLAAYLKEMGITHGMLIAVCIHRCPEMIITLLAILKAGGAYVPVDPTYPENRIQLMLDDISCKLLITTSDLLKTRTATLEKVETVICIDQIQNVAAGLTAIEPDPELTDESLAYIMYTSGSTGKPKGVMVAHKNVVSLVKDITYTSLEPKTVLLSTGSVSFDAVTYEYWGVLLNGGRLVLTDEAVLLDPASLKALLYSQKVNQMWFTTGWLNQLIDLDLEIFRNLSSILTGGEKISENHILKLRNAYSKLEIINCYGPTENTTFSLTYNIGEVCPDRTIPIGRPLDNRTVYVLGDQLQLLPVGEPGEIFVGGDGLALGYLNLPELTTEKFIRHPFSDHPEDRLYRTGDLGCWLPDGNIEYLGRIDDQIKIRGYRIEPGEIENVLKQYAQISGAAVVVKTDRIGAKRLIAYVVTSATIVHENIYSWLKLRLPEYMIPHVFVTLESFPLTVNGKLDKQKLPEPQFDKTAGYQKPVTEMEIACCRIWAETLILENVGVHDNFFRIGGNSLLAMQAAHQMSKMTGLKIKVADIFRFPDIAGLLTHAQDNPEVIIPRTTLKKAPLSFAQDRLWFVEQYEEGTNAYHIPEVYQLDADASLEGIRYALGQIVSRHEILRSTLESDGELGKNIQTIHDASLTITSINTTEDAYPALLNADINRPFELSREYPIRVILYLIHSAGQTLQGQPETVILLINTHHIAGDGWSQGVFHRELTAYYDAYIHKNTIFSLPEPEIQYKDYAIWQRTYLNGEVLEKQLAYWKNKLSGFQILTLPLDSPRPLQLDYQGQKLTFGIDEKLSGALRSMAKRNQVTLHSVMLSSMYILLGKYSGQDDILIGSPIANRHHEQTQQLLGFFVNMQVNRGRLHRHQSFEELIRQVHEDQIVAQQYQDLPFEKLVDELDAGGDASRHPLFQVSFSVESFDGMGGIMHSPHPHLRPLTVENYYTAEKFDLSVFVYDHEGPLTCAISYATSLFRKDTIVDLVTHYLTLLEQLVTSPGLPHSQFSMLNEQEYHRLIYEWNETARDYRKDKSLAELFNVQAALYPDKIAVVFDNQSLSYRELHERSNQLARQLRSRYKDMNGKDLSPDTCIALYTGRNLEMLTGLLGILKAGAAYVPIDPAYPVERVMYQLKDTNVAFLLCLQQDGKKVVKAFPEVQIIYLDAAENYWRQEDRSDLSLHSTPSSLAYVIYTSGTTGTPKGVLIEQKSVVNLIDGLLSTYNFDADEKFLLFSNSVFDAAVEQTFLSLLSGNTLFIIDNETMLDKVAFIGYVNHHGITQLDATPSYLHNIDPANLQSVKRVVFGGEYLPVELFLKYKAVIPTVVNAYGPTETTVTGLVSSNGPLLKQGGIPNTMVYLLDEALVPVPIGVPGELYIGGAGVARGYLNQPDITASRFIANPFATEKDLHQGYNRLYKTDDLFKWTSDGHLIYLGRNDDQVKINGFRIELAEIEHALSKVEGIKQSCVLVKEKEVASQRIKYLVGYYVPETPGLIIEEASVRETLSLVLPDYMVPHIFVHIESFELTSSGKLDKQKLPDPEPGFSHKYMAPAVEMETITCRIWMETLGLNRVGVNDNFFRIGGNSLLAMQVSYLMSKALERHIKVADVFRFPTIARLLAYVHDRPEVIIPRSGLQKAPLSFAQHRLWFIEQYEEGTNAYHIPEVYALDKNTDREGIKYALQQIVSRHEILRSTLERDGDRGQGRQIVRDKPLVIPEIHTTECAYQELLKAGINQTFDLSLEYPIRTILYLVHAHGQTSDEEPEKVILLINIHHVASDGWSLGVFHRELAVYYEAYINQNRAFQLPELEIQYKDYAIWQRNYLTGKVLENQLDYWKDRLSGFQALSLPVDFIRPPQMDYRGATLDIHIHEKLSEKLRTMAQECNVTLHTLMLSSMYILLGKYSGQDDIVIGSPIANRHYDQIRSLIGFFVNTQINRAKLYPDQSFNELIQKVHEHQISAQLHQDLPFEKLVEELNVERDPSRHPLFQVFFVVQSFENEQKNRARERQYLQPLGLEGLYDVTKFDFSIHIDDSETAVSGSLNYATSLYRKETMERLITHYLYLLEQLTAAPDQQYSDFGLCSPEEYTQIFEDWNQTDQSYPDNKTIHELFRQAAVKYPDQIALVFETKEMSYRELDEITNRLARHIRKQYLKKTHQQLNPDTLIALYTDRGLEMVIGILAILKAGAAYVPLDTSYPQDRIDYILNDTGAALILTKHDFSVNDAVKLPGGKTLDISLSQAFYMMEDASPLPSYSAAADLVYVLYTSGTTGKPKGVMLEHFSVCNRIMHMISCSEITKADQYLFKTNYIFDVSFSDIFAHLCAGATLYVTRNLFDPDELNELLFSKKIMSLHLVPSQFSTLAATIEKGCPQKIYFSGEALTQQILTVLADQPIAVYNYYGPTELGEITVHRPANPAEAAVIGKVFPNSRHYVLDQHKNPVPVGIIGELYVGGAGIARGYFNQPDLTRERFISNPFITSSDLEKGYTRLYKTGDLVKWLPDGNLEYIGRNDDQVKINGFRIELAEVEYALSQIEGLKQSAILVKQRKVAGQDTKYLVAYFVPENKALPVTQTQIQDRLSLVLPEYMVPQAFVTMTSFPLTNNGKLDKQKLPDPDPALKSNYVAPVTAAEREACKVWAETLENDQIGIHDNFFGVGGNSILAIQISHRLSKVLGRQIKVSDIFRFPTVAKLLAHVQDKPEVVIPRSNLKEAPLSFAQHRLWFIEQYEEGTNAYHMPEVYELHKDTDLEGIKYALQKIVSRHEVLRSTLRRGGKQGQGIQVVHDSPLTIAVERTTANACPALLKTSINQPFDLSKEYPLRVVLFLICPDDEASNAKPEKVILLINTHHIASDGWSIGVFHRELAAYYEAYINGNTKFSLAELEIQYKDYAIWQRDYLNGDALDNQLNYWKNRLAGFQSLSLPLDFSRPARMDYRGAELEFSINDRLSDALRAIAKKHQVTLNSVMLSSMYILMGKYSGQKDIVIGSPIANRHYEQTRQLIGFFVNMQVNRGHLRSDQSFEELIHQVHEDQVAAQLHQDLPFEKLVDELSAGRDTSRHPLFQVSFSVERFDGALGRTPKVHSCFTPFLPEEGYNAEKFDLSFYIFDHPGPLTCFLSYATSLFRKDTIVDLVAHYLNLLEQLVDLPALPYSGFSLLNASEHEQLIYEWNETERDYPENKSLSALFCLQAALNPNKIAAVFEGQELSYRKLHEKSNQLARQLRSRYLATRGEELKPDTRIALYTGRNLEMLIGLLGILKAGAAYVPIDPAYPVERVMHQLKDTNATFILCLADVGEQVVDELADEQVVYIDASENFYQTEDVADLPPYSSASDLAYVIYTSGTSGVPKGVMVEQRSVVNLIDGLLERYDFDNNEKILLFSNYVFDASAEQIFLSILSGNTLFIIDPLTILDGAGFVNYINHHGITHLDATPSYLHNINPANLHSVKRVVFGGESLSVELFMKYNAVIPTVVNAYGPTETTITVLISADGPLLKQGGIPNTKVYLLDEQLIPVAIGVPGELYIGGTCVARGYLNQHEMTAARFITNPYATESDRIKGHDRLYKTGDLMHWLTDGSLVYLGRNDDQVKINGFRIELAEVEHALAQVKGIQQCCVVTKERGTAPALSNTLVGYYVPDKNMDVKNDNLILNNWEDLHDDDYEKEVSPEDITSDFSGWDSYITSSPIPIPEMECWRTDILNSIIQLNPQHLLEIGVGSGLLMYPLIDRLAQYVGIDLSKTVIERHKKVLEGKECDVSLYHLKADEVDQLPLKQNFDTVIINSVCQYFPGIHYFEEVVDKALAKLAPNGKLFLGDIRNYNSHKSLIKAKLEFEQRTYTASEIDHIAIKENELLISPEYFNLLHLKYENIQIDIKERKVDYANELSWFRYDVVITNTAQVITKKNPVKDQPAHQSNLNYYNVPYLNQLSREEIVRQLAITLPPYMIPEVLIPMDSLPLTINGKLDRRALPDFETARSSMEYIAPKNQLESRVCAIWQEVLSLDRVGTNDDFFSIGGNSILAIQAVYNMGTVLKDIKVADIFRLKTVQQLVANHEQYFELVKPYATYYDSRLPDLVFIAPGRAGAEMYQQLAETLGEKYNCIGIDNYNIHHDEKIASLNKLAHHYLGIYQQKYQLKTPVNIIGWSLGGQIALEMAVILEEQGYQEINVTLLDTFIADDEEIEVNLNDAEKMKIRDQYHKMLSQYEEAYQHKIIAAIEVENEIGVTPISGYLKHTRVVLFKASKQVQKADDYDADIAFINKIHGYFEELPANNIDLFADHVKVIELDCHHFDILETNGTLISNYLKK